MKMLHVQCFSYCTQKSKKVLFVNVFCKHYVIIDAVESHGMSYLLLVLIYRQHMTRSRLLRLHCLSAPDKDSGFDWRSLLNTLW